MNQALWDAKTGLDAQQTRMAVVSNNLANVNTTGYKQGRAVFEDLLVVGGTAAVDRVPGSAQVIELGELDLLGLHANCHEGVALRARHQTSTMRADT